MSASNWCVCPRCFAEATEAARVERERVMGLYGTVPVEEFDKARSALEEPDPESYQTFREDYEFYGADQRLVEASYKGECTRCGLTADLLACKRFWPPPE